MIFEDCWCIDSKGLKYAVKGQSKQPRLAAMSSQLQFEKKKLCATAFSHDKIIEMLIYFHVSCHGIVVFHQT